MNTPNDSLLEPITEDDAALAEHLEAADLPALMLALVHLNGNLDHLRGDIRPLTEFLNPDDGLSDEQRARVRAMAADALKRYRDDPQPFYMPTGDELMEMLRVSHRRKPEPGIHRVSHLGAVAERRRPVPPAGHRHRARGAPRRFPRADHRRGHVRAAVCRAAAGSGHCLRHRGEERRRRRYLVRKHLSGLPRRQPQPRVFLLLPAPGLAAALLRPGSAAQLLRRYGKRIPPARAHPFRYRGDRGALGRRHAAMAGDRAARWRHLGTAGGRGDQRGGPAQPAAPAGHCRRRELRRPLVSLCRMAASARPHRQSAWA